MKLFYKALFLLFFNSLFLRFHSFSQQSFVIEWAKCYGGSIAEHARSIQPTQDGGFIVAGITNSNDGDVNGNHDTTGFYVDFWVIKIDSSGTLQWQKCYGGTVHDGAFACRQTADGGYIVSGTASSNDGDVSGNHTSSFYVDYWIIKLDASGNLQWQKCLGGTNHDNNTLILQTSDLKYVAVGKAWSNDGDVSGNHGGNDVWIVKIDTAGNIEWQKCYGGTNNEEALYAQQTNDGGFIIAGDALSDNGDVSGNHDTTGISGDLWLLKIDSIGTLIWQKCLGGTHDDVAYNFQLTSDGGYIIAGGTNSIDGDVSGNHDTTGTYYDAWIIKTDSMGTIQWQKCLGGTNDEGIVSVQVADDGNYMLAGSTLSNNGDVSGNHGGIDFWIVKLDSLGVLLWKKCYGGTLNDSPYSLCKSQGGGFAIAGFAISNNGNVTGNHGNGDVWIVKLSPDSITGISPAPTLPGGEGTAIAPNPSNGIFQITFPSSSSNQKTNYTLEVINTLGQTVFATQPETRNQKPETKLDLSFLPKGIYVLKINDGVSAISRKLVIE